MPVDTKRLPVPDASENPSCFSPVDGHNPTSITENGKRTDGRTAEQIRPIFIKAGMISQAKGSAYIETNNTKIICAVYGPREVTRREEWSMKGQLSCEFKYATFSRQKRKSHQQDSEEKDISVLIQEALSPAVCLDKFPKARMDVFITVLEDDGSCVASALTAASVALSDAGIHMYDVVIGASLKQSGDKLLLDPTYQEENHKTDKSGETNGCLTVGFMPSLYQTCAFYQTGKLSVEALCKASQLCIDTCVKIYPVVQNCLVQSLSQQGDT